MSNYKRVTRHPITGKYENAEYIDDYFMPHVYGIKFPSEDKVYPVDLVANNQITTFWVEDVVKAFDIYLQDMGVESTPEELMTLLDNIEIQYKARWKRDPIGGEGALDDFTEKYRPEIIE